MGTVLRREQCPACAAAGRDTSEDNLAVYEDGAYCHACGYSTRTNGAGDGGATEATSVTTSSDTGSVFTRGQGATGAFRGLLPDTLRKYRTTFTEDGTTIFPYYSRGRLVAQHTRGPSKDFRWEQDPDFKSTGSTKRVELFGSHLWKAGGRQLVITEGEFDAMSVSQSLDNRWPVVSVPNGASSALDSIKNNIEYVSSFDKVIFAFDMDEPGQQAARTCAEFLPPGKAFIASFSLKDANEMIQEKKKQELVDALWQAAPVRPDDIVNARTINLKELSAKDDTKVYPFPWPELTKKMLGVRSGELTVITSGTGMGKSTVVREMIYDDLKNGRKVGAIMLEEGVVDTLHDLMALELEKPVRKILTLRKIQKQLPDVDLGVADELSDEEYNEAFESIAGSGNLFLYDHFGSMDPDVLLNKMYYMAKTLGCEKIYLDHISIVISGSDNDNERKEIDRMMTGLRSFVEECNVAVTTVSHLRKSNSTAPEEGGRVRMQDLRGSGSIAQLADVIFGCERNPQSTVEGQSDVLVIRSLKDRFGGFHGPAAALRYDRTTARCREIDNWTVDSNETIVIKEPEPEGVTI